MIKQISYFPVLSKFFEVTVINRAIPFEYNVLYKNAKPIFLFESNLFKTDNKNFEIDSKGNWWAYYTDEVVKHLSEPWEEEADKYAKDPIGDTTNLYLEANHKYEEKLKSLKEKKYIGPIDVKFFGMASADGQKSISGEKTKTAEGITKWLPVKYTLSGWVENMISYLCSAMSYCNCFTLEQFIWKQKLIPNSISEIQAVNK